MSWLTGWRLPLRLARRNAMRARGRSILVLVMIALPVLAVTAADVLIHTQDLTGVESLDRRLGAAEARVVTQDGVARMSQGFDPDIDPTLPSGGRKAEAATAEEVRRALGDGARLLEQRVSEVTFATDKGIGSAEGTEVDLADPLTRGLFELTSGSLPRTPGEVVVNQALADKGYAVGDVLALEGDAGEAADPLIVGTAESTAHRNFPVAAGPLGSLGLTGEGTRTWLVGGAEVGWSQVEELNALGATVLSRAVLLDPPPDSVLDPELSQYDGGTDEALVAVAALVVVMALIEVVLLAGPAFAVGARRQQRSLALMSAAGGTPKQSRRVVLGGALVLGGLASLLGVVLGIGLARLLAPLLQSLVDSRLGPFEVPWLQLAGIGLFGLVSALLASVVPAWIASRQDVVAVLAGRRSDRPPSLRSPVLGLLLLGAGVLGAAYGARSPWWAEYSIAVSAIFAVLGMILLVPVVLALLARLSGRLPLALRYAVRDAARHRSRTVPAVAAVAATVAGVVALGIATSSDEAQNEAQYVPSVADGVGVLSSYDGVDRWSAYDALLAREVPDARVVPVWGLAESTDGGYTSVDVRVPGTPYLLSSSGSALGSQQLVSDDELPPGLLGVPDASRGAAAEMLRSGGVVAFTDQGATGAEVRVRVVRRDEIGRRVGEARTATVPALIVPVSGSSAGPNAVLSTATVEQLGLSSEQVSLVVTGTEISDAQEENVTEALTAITESSTFSVERGYVPDDGVMIIQLVLAALGGVLMLGGTLTATFLALSDARPDLATLSAVGASPRVRRGVAAAYAVVVGLVGALLGAAVGFIPGIAVTYPLTSDSYGPSGGEVASHFLEVPWLLILGLVVALPLLTAAVVGLTARSRLPLATRTE